MAVIAHNLMHVRKYFIAKRKLGPEPWREAFWCVFMSSTSTRPVCIARHWHQCLAFVERQLQRRGKVKKQLELRLEPQWRRIP